MERSTKESWLEGPGDLSEDIVEDVPRAGESVKVRALSARFSADVQGQLKLVQEGRDQVAKIDIAAMERLQFLHGVIEPQFSMAEVVLIQEKFGSAFKKVVTRIDELSGIDKEAIAETENRFPAGGAETEGAPVGNGVASGDAGPDLDSRAGGALAHDGG